MGFRGMRLEFLPGPGCGSHMVDGDGGNRAGDAGIRDFAFSESLAAALPTGPDIPIGADVRDG